MGSRALINPEVGQFYCWRWYRWFSVRKLDECFASGCRGMETPEKLRWKQRVLGGQLVPLGAGRAHG